MWPNEGFEPIPAQSIWLIVSPRIRWIIGVRGRRAEGILWVAVIAIAIAAAAWLVEWSPQDTKPSSLAATSPNDRARRAPIESASVQIPNRGLAESRVPTATTLTVRDRLTRKALQATLWCAESTDSKAILLGTTNPMGTIAWTERPESHRTDYKLTTTGDIGAITLELPSKAVLANTDNTCEIDAYARIQIQLPGDMIGSRCWVRLLAIPELPTDLMGGSPILARMKLTRVIDPEAFIDLYKSSFPGAHCPQNNSNVVVSADPIDIDLPYTGDTELSITCPGRIPSITTVAIIRGNASRVSVQMLKPIEVSGLLMDSTGNPVVGRIVTVAAKSAYLPTERIPRAKDEPGNPAFIITTNRTTQTSTVVAQVDVRTNASGRFRASLPFTDEVAAWSYVTDKGKGFISRQLPSRFDSTATLDLTLEPYARTLKMRFLRENGEAVSKSKILLIRGGGLSPFQVSLPAVTTDGDGWCDLSMLDEGQDYRFKITDDQKHMSQPFRCASNGAIVVKVP
jgi:hypothetical protein